MKKEEAKELSDLEISYQILKKEKKGKTTKELFKEICDLLDYNEDHFINMLADFYTSLNLDKRFILLDGKWELKEHHSIKTVVEDELDDLDEIDIDTIDDIDEEDDVESYEDEDEITEEVDIEDEEEGITELDEINIVDEDEIE